MDVSAAHGLQVGEASRQANVFSRPTRLSVAQKLGVLRIEIHGSWSVADIIGLLGHLEDGCRAAAALESLADLPPQHALGRPDNPPASADDLLQTVTAFQLPGLRLGSVHYGSPGFLDVIGALNPLKTVKDGITRTGISIAN